jgi:hypothetical protein
MTDTVATKLDLDHRIIEARERHYLVVLTGYCESARCPAREIEIRIKDYDNDLLQLLSRRGLRCPICGEAAKLHDARTMGEHCCQKDQEACMAVNRQMYERDHRPSRLLPATVLGDDRLPPTPADWWKAR